MVNIKYVYDLVNDLADKNNGRYIDGEEFTRYAQTSNNELFDELIGATNLRANRQSRVVIGVSQDLDSRLKPFRDSATVSVVEGEASVPENCRKILNVLTSKRNPKALIRLDDDRVGMIFGNPLREPDEDDIYYVDGYKNLEVFGNIDSIYINYLRSPISPVYAEKEEVITSGSREVTRKVYDPDNSVDFEWDEPQTLDLVVRILQKAGIPMKDNFIEQMSGVLRNQE